MKQGPAKSKIAYLRERGYQQAAVVMAGPSGCATVSDMGRVCWHKPEFERWIMGAERTAAERHQLDGHHPYMAFCGDPAEGAVLVFARTAKDARRLAYGTLRALFDCDWIDTRVRRLRRHEDYLLDMYDGRYVIDDPPSCDVCGTWGAPFAADGCDSCRDDCDGLSVPPNGLN